MLPLCTECHTSGKEPVLVGRAYKVNEELERKETKAANKRKAEAEKAAGVREVCEMCVSR